MKKKSFSIPFYLNSLKTSRALLYPLFWLILLFPVTGFTQQSGPGSAWTAGVNFGTNSPSGEDAWAFDAVELANGDLLVVGYTEINNGDVRVPAYAILDKFGQLRTSHYYTHQIGGRDQPGAFNQVALSPDGSYAVMVGYLGAKDDDVANDPDDDKTKDAFLVRLETTAYTEDWTKRFAVGGYTGQDRLNSVDITTDDKIVLNWWLPGR